MLIFGFTPSQLKRAFIECWRPAVSYVLGSALAGSLFIHMVGVEKMAVIAGVLGYNAALRSGDKKHALENGGDNVQS